MLKWETSHAQFPAPIGQFGYTKIPDIMTWEIPPLMRVLRWRGTLAFGSNTVLLLGCYAERERHLHNASQGPQAPPSVPRALIMATPQHLPLYKKSGHKLKEALQIVWQSPIAYPLWNLDWEALKKTMHVFWKKKKEKKKAKRKMEKKFPTYMIHSLYWLGSMVLRNQNTNPKK